MSDSVLYTEKITAEQAKQLNPQVLAFVGDGVYTLVLRAHFAKTHTAKAGKLNTMCNLYVNARAQSKDLEIILPVLTDDEHDAMMRARNTHVHSIAKNANIEQYMRATGFEAVFGYLYLIGRQDRINELVNMILEKGERK